LKRLQISKTHLFCLFSVQVSLQVSTIVLLSLFVIQTGFSASISKLYEASVKADGDKPENQLIDEAFTQVLVKVSGRSDVKASPVYATMLKQAESAISQFRYDYKAKPSDTVEADEAVDTVNVDPPQVVNAQEQKQKWFWVRFNAKTINS